MEIEKKNKGTLVVIIILSLVIVGLVGYIAYDKGVFAEKKESSQSTESKQEERNDETSKVEKVSYKVKEGQLYVNGNATKFYVYDRDIYEIDDIIVFAATRKDEPGVIDFPESVYAVNTKGAVIYSFLGNYEEKGENVIYLKGKNFYSYHGNFKVVNKNIYITTNNTGQDPEGKACNSNAKDVLVYTEKFTYLGNNRFSGSTITDTIVAKDYITMNKIECSK